MKWMAILFELVAEFTGLQLFFFVCAVVGGLLLLVRIVLALFVGGGDDLEPGMDVSDHPTIIGDSDATFTVISLQGIVGFVLMFGLTGLTMSIQFECGNLVSTVTAGGVGAAMMLTIAAITLALRTLERPGNLDIQNAIGEVGTVYLTIPASGTGRVRINIQERMRIYDAVTKDQGSIETDARIKVVGIVGGDTLVVERS